MRTSYPVLSLISLSKWGLKVDRRLTWSGVERADGHPVVGPFGRENALGSSLRVVWAISQRLLHAHPWVPASRLSCRLPPCNGTLCASLPFHLFTILTSITLKLPKSMCTPLTSYNFFQSSQTTAKAKTYWAVYVLKMTLLYLRTPKPSRNGRTLC